MGGVTDIYEKEKKKLTNITKFRGNLTLSKGDFRVQMKRLEINLFPFVLSLFTALDLFHRNPPLMYKTVQDLTLKFVLRKSFPPITIKIKILQQVLFSPKSVLTLDSPTQ